MDPVTFTWFSCSASILVLGFVKIFVNEFGEVFGLSGVFVLIKDNYVGGVYIDRIEGPI
jgi:hypothetical protein